MKVEGVPASPPPDRLYQVWHGDTTHELHAVRVEADTVRGVPTSQDRECASCAVAIAKSDIDSIRIREFRSGATTWTVVGVTWILLRSDIIYNALEWFFGR
jgi:hypothetical protein